jgi:hypothetical protein
MSTPIDLQLRGYTEFFETQMRVVDLDEIMERHLGEERVRPTGATTRPQNFGPRRGWLVAVATAVVVLVLLGTAAWLARVTDPDTSPVAGNVVPSTVAQSTPNTVTRAGPEDTPGCEIQSGWLQVCDPASFNGGAMYAVTSGGPGLVAVGANGLEYAVVWTSPDGLTWTRVPHDVATFGGDGGQQMFGVTVGGPGLVAVGRDGPVADGEGNAAVWTSRDGFTWSRVAHDEDVFGGQGEQRMVSVTTGGPGLVAVGTDGYSYKGDEDSFTEGPAEQGEGNAVVWTSRDGFVWSRVAHDEDVFGGQGEQRMVSVTTGGPGLVAVGTDGYSYKGDEDSFTEGPAELAADAAVWTSPDGFTWSRVPHDEAIFGGLDEQRMESVTAGGPGLVAVGSVTGELVAWYAHDAAVWTSPDGFTWSRVPHDEAIFATGGENYPAGAHEERMLSVTAGGPGLVAVGFDSVDDCGWDSAVWTSPDGLNWSRVPDERDCNVPGPYDRMLSVTVGPSGLVAVGEEHYPVAAAVWND